MSLNITVKCVPAYAPAGLADAPLAAIGIGVLAEEGAAATVGSVVGAVSIGTVVDKTATVLGAASAAADCSNNPRSFS